MSEVILITPTGGRPKAMALLAKYVDAQTYQGQARWIIVDDMDPATPLPDSRFGVEVIRPSWRWRRRGEDTQCQSMVRALEQVAPGDIVIIFEDDDVYLPDHMENTLHALQTVELVGEHEARYYNVATRRHRIMAVSIHATLASTAVRGDALALLREVCARPTRSIDINLWHEFHGPKQLTEHTNVVGIKGMPGRAGIGVGHRPSFGEPDNANTLYQWIGNYAEAYEL